MDPNTKRYNDLVSAYKKAYPDLKTALQEQKAQILWNDVKNDSKKYVRRHVRRFAEEDPTQTK